MGCFSGRLMSAASNQKLFCKLCSTFCCSFNEFVEEKVITPSYSSTILTPPLPSIFKKSQALSPFEALNSVCLSSCQRDVIPPVQMRRRPKAFSRDSTGDSDIPSSCELKAVPEFKPLQGNPAFFRVRASRSPFHLRQETQSPSHIPIAEGKLHLRCLWIVGSLLQSKTGNQLSS